MQRKTFVLCSLIFTLTACGGVPYAESQIKALYLDRTPDIKKGADGEDDTLTLFVDNKIPKVFRYSGKLGHQFSGPKIGLIYINTSSGKTGPEECPRLRRIFSHASGIYFVCSNMLFRFHGLGFTDLTHDLRDFDQHSGTIRRTMEIHKAKDEEKKCGHEFTVIFADDKKPKACLSFSDEYGRWWVSSDCESSDRVWFDPTYRYE